MRHSAVLSYALHSEYDAETQRDEEHNIRLLNITLYCGPLLLTPQCVTWKASDPPPTGLKGVRSMSGIQLSHLTLYLLLLRFWTHQNQVLPSLDGEGTPWRPLMWYRQFFSEFSRLLFLRCQLLVLQRCASQWRDAKESKATHCELRKRNWHYPVDKCVKKRTNFWRSFPASRNSHW